MRHLHTIIAITLKWNIYLSTFLRLWLKNSEDFPLQLLGKVNFFYPRSRLQYMHYHCFWREGAHVVPN